MNHLVIMAKQPVAGRVKSRLARDIGDIAAANVYRHLMEGTIARLSRDPRWKTWVAVAPDRAVYEHPWPAGIRVFGQGSGNLGHRMQMIFDALPPGPVIIIGTDIPFITGSDIGKAFQLLGQNDVVFGDAGDGGYWLVGAKRTPRVPKIFDDVRWSGKHALADTLNNCERLTVGHAAERFDIDDRQDYLAWKQTI